MDFENEFSISGDEMFQLIAELYPICRSITGDGVRKSLEIIKDYIPLTIYQEATGTVVFDWVIPKEWNIRDAYIKNSKEQKVVDFKKSNLHVINYSVPIHAEMSLNELKKHLFTLPDFPEWIPYLTSYYNENWGFCISQQEFERLKDDTYEVVIDSELIDGFLVYGELLIKGRTDEEVLFSTYICHPSLCNDNLSGVVLLTYLAMNLLNKDLKYSYRFLFIPETIGSITWLSKHEDTVKNIKYGLVATCVGDSGPSTYKKSREGNLQIDRIVEKVLNDFDEPFNIVDFFPTGSDERQFCSPGFNLPIGSLMRTPYALFPEYHTSADNLDFIQPQFLENSIKKYIQVVFIIENNATFLNKNPKCEPQLGKRGLYRKIGSQKTNILNENAILWVLNLSDGKNSLLDIAIRSKLKFLEIWNAAIELYKVGLLEKVN